MRLALAMAVWLGGVAAARAEQVACEALPRGVVWDRGALHASWREVARAVERAFAGDEQAAAARFCGKPLPHGLAPSCAPEQIFGWAEGALVLREDKRLRRLTLAGPKGAVSYESSSEALVGDGRFLVLEARWEELDEEGGVTRPSGRRFALVEVVDLAAQVKLVSLLSRAGEAEGAGAPRAEGAELSWAGVVFGAADVARCKGQPVPVPAPGWRSALGLGPDPEPEPEDEPAP